MDRQGEKRRGEAIGSNALEAPHFFPVNLQYVAFNCDELIFTELNYFCMLLSRTGTF